ncbi:Protein PPP5D1, partial [Plecturocebus cupreus]
MPVPHRTGPSWVRCACCETLSPQRFQLLFSLWGWDQPSPSVPYTLHREAPRWGTGKTATPAKRVALATRVAPLPGISRSVGNKNSSEIQEYMNKSVTQVNSLALSPGARLEGSGTILSHYILPLGFKQFSCLSLPSLAMSPKLECSDIIMAHCSLNLLGSRNPPPLASQVAGTTGPHPPEERVRHRNGKICSLEDLALIEGFANMLESSVPEKVLSNQCLHLLAAGSSFHHSLEHSIDDTAAHEGLSEYFGEAISCQKCGSATECVSSLESLPLKFIQHGQLRWLKPKEFLSCHPGCSAMARSQITATSANQVQ